MALIVQKYGGTSVADPERMRNVARHIAATRAAGHDLVVVWGEVATPLPLGATRWIHLTPFGTPSERPAAVVLPMPVAAAAPSHEPLRQRRSADSLESGSDKAERPVVRASPLAPQLPIAAAAPAVVAVPAGATDAEIDEGCDIIDDVVLAMK
jgi:hypothetical protein